MKGDAHFPLTADQEKIAAEIARLLAEQSDFSRSDVLGKVRSYIHTLIRGLPVAKKFFSRNENKVHAEEIIKTIDTLKRLIKTAPEGLTSSFFLGSACDEDLFYKQLDHIRNGHYIGLIGPHFGHHHLYDLAAQWCAEFGAKLMEEIVPGKRISSADHNSLFPSSDRPALWRGRWV